MKRLKKRPAADENAKRYARAVKRDQIGYARWPVEDDEFGPLMCAQEFPKDGG
jgi:hypothetical protein